MKYDVQAEAAFRSSEPTRKHYSKLPPVRGFTRVPDDRGRRMVRCDVCLKVIPSLGVGYHNQNGPGCRQRAGGRAT